MNARSRKPLSRHFDVEEFDSRDGAFVSPADYGALAHLCSWYLEPMRDYFGACTVHSGFRTPAHNRKVGGARNSVHLLMTPLPNRTRRSTTKAAAADVTFESGTPSDWARRARIMRGPDQHLGQRGRGGVGQYSTFVHVDTGPARDW
jgi:hypothetical protein